MTTGRSLVLVVLDSARADAFGAATPNLSDLRQRGVGFDRAIAPGGWTLPSHTSMFSGLLPTEHQVVGLPGGAERVLANARRRIPALDASGHLIAPRLAARGVRTFLATASPWLTMASGLDRGFGTKDQFGFLQTPPHRPKVKLPKRVRQSVNTAYSVADHARWVRSGRDKGAERVLSGMEEFIGRDAAPFFACTTLMETHEPHLPPEPAERDLANKLNVIVQPGLVRLLRMHAHNWGSLRLPQRLIDRWRRAYLREIAYVDAWLGRLLEMLERTGRAEETVVVVTGDHGENFGEGGLVGHGLSLRESLANVPLVIGGADIPAQSAVSEPVSLIRLADTIDDLMLGPNESSLLRTRDGRAVMEVEHPAHVAHRAPGAKRHARGPGAAFYDGSLKLVVEPFAPDEAPPRLCDLATDPSEALDLWGERAPTAWQAAEMDRWRERAAGLPS